MKQFSIRKAVKPHLNRSNREEATPAQYASADEGAEQPSLLSPEEKETAGLKDVKVVNPWIHQQTHQEYLESIKVSFPSLTAKGLPARHGNVIKKHTNIVREKLFQGEGEQTGQKDQAT